MAEVIPTDLAGIVIYGLVALLSIMNPVGNAVVFCSLTSYMSEKMRTQTAFKVACNSVIVLLVTKFTGDFILEFFGLSVPVVRIGGGILVFHAAWNMLNTKSKLTKAEASKAEDETEDISFVPLTMPLTAGPGSIAVVLDLAAKARELPDSLFWTRHGAALIVFSILFFAVYLCYRYSPVLVRRLGPAGASVLSRVTAFLILLIGVSMITHGLQDLFLV